MAKLTEENIKQFLEKHSTTGKVIEKLAEYKELEDKKMLLRLPCQINDIVWFIFHDGCSHEGTVSAVEWSNDVGFKLTINFDIERFKDVSTYCFFESSFNEHIFFGEDAEKRAREKVEYVDRKIEESIAEIEGDYCCIED